MPWLEPLSLSQKEDDLLLASISVLVSVLLLKIVYSFSIANSYLYSTFLVKIIGRNSGSQVDTEETLKVA